MHLCTLCRVPAQSQAQSRLWSRARDFVVGQGSVMVSEA